jgi:acyl-[acyl-carrier-protein] desaturase
VAVYLEHDRDGTLEEMRRVMNGFAMPAIEGLAEGRRRVAAVKELDLMSEDIYYREVYLPILQILGVTRAEMRNRVRVPR